MRIFYRPADNFRMSQMNTVKSPQGDNRLAEFSFLRVADDFHCPNMLLTSSVADRIYSAAGRKRS